MFIMARHLPCRTLSRFKLVHVDQGSSVPLATCSFGMTPLPWTPLIGQSLSSSSPWLCSRCHRLHHDCARVVIVFTMIVLALSSSSPWLCSRCHRLHHDCAHVVIVFTMIVLALITIYIVTTLPLRSFCIPSTSSPYPLWPLYHCVHSAFPQRHQYCARPHHHIHCDHFTTAFILHSLNVITISIVTTLPLRSFCIPSTSSPYPLWPLYHCVHSAFPQRHHHIHCGHFTTAFILHSLNVITISIVTTLPLRSFCIPSTSSIFSLNSASTLVVLDFNVVFIVHIFNKSSSS